MANAMAAADTEVKAAMDKAVAAANRRDDMLRSGTNSADGLIAGLNTAISRAADSGNRAASAYMNAYNARMDQHSPSKEMFRRGSDTVQGLINGYKSREDDLKEQAKAAADILKEQFKDNDEAKELLDDFMDYYEDALKAMSDNAKIFAEATQDRLDELEDAWDEAAKKQEKMAEKLSGYGDLFTEEKGRYQVESLNEQIDALNRYEEILSTLRDERGISQGLLDEMVGMGIDDAIGYGEKLLAMGEKQFEEYNAKWEEKQQRAKEIAEAFYRNEFDALSAAYSNVLERGLEELNNIGFDSGVDFAQYLMDGMLEQRGELMAQARQMANDIKAVIDSALNYGGSAAKKNGSHALGISYVPFDGYIAELHKGERVLTASETQAYIDASTPQSFDLPAERQLAAQQTAALVNAIGTLTAGAAQQQGGDPATIILQTGEGMELARWLLPSIREASAQSPEVERDF